MASTIEEDPVRSAAGILDQILEYTRQLAASKSDPTVDVMALADACADRLEGLKIVLPQALRELDLKPEHTAEGSKEKKKISQKIRHILDQTLVCQEILGKVRAQISTDIERLSTSKRAIRAYSSK